MTKTICPRCGLNVLHPEEAMNALSRRRKGAYICSPCGTEEGIFDYQGLAPLEKWALDKKEA